MPRLPSAADLGARPDIPVSAGAVPLRATSGNETAPGLALARAGQTIAGVADDFLKLVKEEERRVNTTKAEEAFTKLRERQLDLTIGEDGFVNKRGGDAINQPLLKDYTGRFDQITKEIEASLANPEQVELFRKRAGVSGLQFREDLMRHIASEGNVYAKQAYEGGVNVELRSATSRWQDPTAVALSLERISGLVDQESDRLGWSPEQREAELLKRTSAVHNAVIGQALATDNYIFAQKWYEANKDAIDPTTAKAVQAAVDEGVQKQTYAEYQRDFLGAQDDLKSLAALKVRVDTDQSLDLTRRNALVGRIQSREAVLENRQRLAADKLERRIAKAIENARGNMLAGFEPTTEQLAPILNAARGTELEAEAQALVQAANATSAFRNSPPAAQEATLARAEAALRKDPTKVDRRLLEGWRTIHENQKRRLEDSPVSFAVQQGLIEPNSPAGKPLDLSSPINATEGLMARIEVARALTRSHNAPFKPLTEEEASLVVNQLKAATVTQKREWLGDLATATQGDAEGYSAIMAQIAQDAPVIAIAGEYAGKGRDQASTLMLRGESILRPDKKEDGTAGKLLPMPPEREMRRIFDDTVRDAFAGMPKASSDHYQAARAIYAAMSADAGDPDTAVLDPDRWEQAINMATGGVHKYKGRNIVLPFGHTTSQFRDGLARRVEDVVASGRLGPEWDVQKLLDLPLQPVGDGKYAFVVGDSLLAVPKKLGIRQDGTEKGTGFLGMLRRPDGLVSTEISIGVEIEGKEMEIPTIVPTLSREELDFLLNEPMPFKRPIPESIVEKAVAHARKRLSEGKPVFATPEESEAPPMVPLIIDFNTSVPFRTSGHGLHAAAQEPTAAEIAAASKPVTGRVIPRRRPAQAPAAAKPKRNAPIIGVRG